MERTRYSLNGRWQFSFHLGGRLYTSEAAVPGNVEPVLQSLGLVGDYMPVDDPFVTSPFETVDDWTYTTVFDAPPLSDVCSRELVFEGIDTIAEVYLNGEKLGDCLDMHCTYRYPVSLREKGNELTVVIRSVDLWARRHPHDEFGRPHNANGFYDSQTYVRKARHQWGWDNAPRLITAGIVRSVYLEDLPPKRFEHVYFYTAGVSDTAADVGLSWTYTTDAPVMAGHRIRFSLWDREEKVFEEIRPAYFVQGYSRFSLSREKIRLWWPSGFGDPQLYTARVEMLEGDKTAAVHEMQVGIRTLRTVHTDDVQPDGSGDFVFVVNGERVFIRGANWKPLHPLCSQADEKTKSLEALGKLTELHCNMVRIWGGGIYEDEAFFDYCDRHGIMVWQDFMLACEIPPTDEFFCRLLAKEAKEIVIRQRNHPSMAIWCGDNENDQCMTWIHSAANVRPSHSVSTRRILRDAVLHFDPYRDYVDSSPVYSDEYWESRSRPDGPYPTEMHLYPPVPEFAARLRECRARFIGETGPIGVNSVAVNRETFEKEKARMERLWDAPAMMTTDVHQDDGYFVKWRRAGKAACQWFYGRDFAFAEWKEYALAINVLCAEVFKDALEYSRVMRWTKTGIIWWSLCDMFPMGFNYSVMDHELNPKLAYHWIEHSQKELCLMAVRTELSGEPALYAANDTRETKRFTYTVTQYDGAGNGQIIASGTAVQAPNSSSLIQRIAEPEEASLWVIRYSDGEESAANHAFTGKCGWDVMRRWIRILEKELDLGGKILEIL